MKRRGVRFYSSPSTASGVPGTLQAGRRPLAARGGGASRSPALDLCDVGQCLPRVRIGSYGRATLPWTHYRARTRPEGPALGTMLFLVRLAVFLSLCGCSNAQGQTKEEDTEEVKIEVLHRPENCSKTSRKGDLLNAHYDGYLAKDGSKFYCR